jgi:hypothetical protein
MKSFVQYALLLGIIVGAVFGLTFLTQNARTPVEKPIQSDPTKSYDAIAGPPLRIREKTAEWDRGDSMYAAEFERGTNGHYDFWVSNLHAEPVNVALLKASCVCSKIHVGIIPADEMAGWQQRTWELGGISAAMDLLGVPNLAAVLAYRDLSGKIRWSELERRDKNASAGSTTVPAAHSPEKPQMAIIRMDWEGRDVKADRLIAEVQHRIGTTTDVTPFEVRVMIVPPVMVSTPVVSVGELNFNDRRNGMIYCWSATRDQFQVTIEDASHDPCIEAGPPRLLNDEERMAVTQMLRGSNQIPPTKMRTAYAIPVVVHERRGSAQLDLGPLNRKLELRTDTSPDPMWISLQGMIRGAIDVGEGKEQDRVNLGSFRSDRPHDKTVIVTAKDPNIQLRFKKVSPDYLNVSLTELTGSIGFRQWRLKVEVEPDRVAGLLPADSAVYLETVATPPRAIRIPVMGNGTVR